VKNLLEELVYREYERLRPAGFCGCRQCRDDVIVFVLNRLPPRYVAAHEGEVIGHVALGRDQPIADVSMALVEGFRLVASSPRAGHAGGKTGG
jgi:competence protein ComFB